MKPGRDPFLRDLFGPFALLAVLRRDKSRRSAGRETGKGTVRCHPGRFSGNSCARDLICPQRPRASCPADAPEEGTGDTACTILRENSAGPGAIEPALAPGAGGSVAPSRDAPRSASRGRKKERQSLPEQFSGNFALTRRAAPAAPLDRQLSPEMKESKTECTVLREFLRLQTRDFGVRRAVACRPLAPVTPVGREPSRTHDSQGIFEGVVAA
jgi:hypothetical protein